jgi:uncharacterized protein YndB with AHSA1/START domain
MQLAVSLLPEVLAASPGGFSLRHEVLIDATREEVWRAAVDDIGRWWSSDHTISGDAANLSIDANPQGCFCESIGEHAGVVHLTVTFVNPNVILRLTGGLGPLGLMGVDGNMTWEFFDDDGTRVRFNYIVGGYRPGGLDEIAAAVDAVIGDALQRLKVYTETGQPERRDD